MAERKNSFFDVALELAPVALLSYVGYKIVTLFDNPNDKKQQETQIVVEDEINKKISAGQQPSYSESQFKQFADLLQSAMEGMGTDEEAIYSVMAKMYSDLDVLMLVKAFGIRWYKELFFGENYTLVQWLNNELSTYGIDVINNILAGRGIKYSF